MKLKLSKKQNDELQTLLYFTPEMYKDIEVTDDDIKKYFEWSDKGMHKECVNSTALNGFNALVWGKRRRGIHIAVYESGVLDRTTPYKCLLVNNGIKMPRPVVDYLKRTMFGGESGDFIEEAYNMI